MNGNQYRRTPRANFINYDAGTFFITICTKNKFHYFGEILNEEMHLTEIGVFVKQQLSNASRINANIEIPVFSVMPNHIHAIVYCRHKSGEYENPAEQRSPNFALRANPTCQRHVPTLSRYVSSLKGVVTKFAKQNNFEFGWQSRYHDHAIRNSKDGNNISEYIKNNVAQWANDCFNTHRR